MHYNGSLYIYSIDLIRNGSLNYTILIYDEAFNSYTDGITNIRTLDFEPAILSDYGVDFNMSKPGEVIFWANITDPCEDFSTKLSVFNETHGSWIVNNVLMISNETHYIYQLTILYTHSYSYYNIVDTLYLHGLQCSGEIPRKCNSALVRHGCILILQNILHFIRLKQYHVEKPKFSPKSS